MNLFNIEEIDIDDIDETKSDPINTKTEEELRKEIEADIKTKTEKKAFINGIFNKYQVSAEQKSLLISELNEELENVEIEKILLAKFKTFNIKSRTINSGNLINGGGPNPNPNGKTIDEEVDEIIQKQTDHNLKYGTNAKIKQ